jgi:hypothetical protein
VADVAASSRIFFEHFGFPVSVSFHQYPIPVR